MPHKTTNIDWSLTAMTIVLLTGLLAIVVALG
jgi:hypothetical protein